MPTQPYHLPDGTRVPSVTTILGAFKGGDGLTHWAWKLGTEGRDYKQVRDDAAAAGTLAHAMIEADLRGWPAPDTTRVSPAIRAEAETAFAAYCEWRFETDAVPDVTEQPLVHPVWRYGGTLDALKSSAPYVLFDWKTSEEYREDMGLQVAAYCNLWEANHPGKLIDHARVVLFSRTGKGFNETRLPRAELCRLAAVFWNLRMAYMGLKDATKFLESQEYARFQQEKAA